MDSVAAAPRSAGLQHLLGRDGTVVGAETDSAGMLAALPAGAAGRALADRGNRWRRAGRRGRRRGDGARRRGPLPHAEPAAEFRARGPRAPGCRWRRRPTCRVVINAPRWGSRPGRSAADRPARSPRGRGGAGHGVRAGRDRLGARDARGGTPRRRRPRGAGRAGRRARFECWFPGVRAPVEVMRAAVDAALG